MRRAVYSTEDISAQVHSLLKKYHAKQAVLFGSYARQEADEQSDIDLVVIGGDEFDPTDIFSLADDLYVSMGKNVDVYEIREINPDTDFYNAVFSEGVRIT